MATTTNNDLSCLELEVGDFQIPKFCLKEEGKIIGVFLINVLLFGDLQFEGNDWSDQAKFQAAIDAGAIKVIKPTRGDFKEPSPQEEDGDGFVDKSLLTMDFSQEFSHKGVDGNLEFYNALNYSRDWSAGFVFKGVDSKLRAWVPMNEEETEPVQVSFVAAPYTEGKYQRFKITTKWTHPYLPKCKLVPRSIFE